MRSLLTAAVLICPQMVIGSFVMCPYCDPNYLAYPNLKEPCRGYDLPMGNPNPDRGKTDPGIRNQIFNPMIQNADGYYAMRAGFLTANIMIKCDASWNSEVFDNFKDYVKGKASSLTTGVGISLTPEVDLNAGALGMDAQTKIPSIFSRSSGAGGDVEKTKDFFTKERGSIAVSEAICITQRVDISDRSKKAFMAPFESIVQLLYKTTAADNATKLKVFKGFVREFGTHYSSSTDMGTKLTIERRYTSQERSEAGKDEIKACNTLVGSQLFGFQTEINEINCTNNNLMKMGSESDNLERTVISTYGSFIADSLIEWTKQVVTLVQNNAFEPHSIKRKLVPIQDLFTSQNFDHILIDGKPMNVSIILPWFTDHMDRYCEIFEVDCNLTGCGVDDKCPENQFCVDNTNKTLGEDGLRYTCAFKEVEVVLFNGQSYIGEVNIKNLPHGTGKLFRDKLREQLEYEGSFKDGLMDGEGTFYYKDGAIQYIGHFDKGMINGYGVHYYENGRVMYDGEWKFGSFVKGKLFTEEGDLFNEYL
ncbi:uncharacterized protein LOC111705962 isoform X2 [Eurytemora carolleeae]|uniref:uncharacterized protein LOC111705962 isoform X2 n=1 Tax=Eurytemora carolleeae TaxID=1294199 RepID=UPI000C790668|nr:uncharacterized protein LOC111705962 isoform X2 [Eurytemora carolleeae]|eukprot:XP_023334455.1 uncharacterized protein LOC111705962 isoform X2 [Eurytemora affinis]